MKAILLIDHGSKREAANQMLEDVAKVLRGVARDYCVEIAHMELAKPTIADGFKACVKRGAKEVVAVPYMLSPGRHSTEDIPRMVEEAAREYQGVSWRVSECLGVSEKICEVVMERVWE